MKSYLKVIFIALVFLTVLRLAVFVSIAMSLVLAFSVTKRMFN